MSLTSAFSSAHLHRTAFRRLGRGLAILATLLFAFPIFAAPAAAATPTSTGRLDDEIVRKLQTTSDSQRIPVIVEGAFNANEAVTLDTNERRAQRAEDRVRGTGGAVLSKSNLIGATVAELTPAQIRTLAADSSVGHIHFDAPVAATGQNVRDRDDDNDKTATTGTPIVYPQTIGAPEAWRAGETGHGVTVAVLDTGIDTNAAFGNRVKARVDFINPNHPAQGDPAGHGTHIAGLVAAARTSAAPGIAPEANLVSVRVLDSQGQSRLSTVIRGLEWAVTQRTSLGIRVVVMALGAPAVGSYREDPLAAATEMAWRSGLVVVTAAGNEGPGAGTIQTPGYDPLLLTIGASDDAGTASVSDDSIPFWASVGPTNGGAAKPDLIAPGRKIVGLRVPGATLDTIAPDHIEGPLTFRLSGSSQAVGIAGGAVALLLDQRPDLSPDEVKALLISSARSLNGISRSAQGAGSLNIARALDTRTPRDARQHVAPSFGLLRAILPQLKVLAQHDEVLWDKVRWDKVRWDKVRWDQVEWDKVRWDQVEWDKVRWDAVIWDKVRWDQVVWDKVRWDLVTWDKVRWDRVRWD